MEESIVLYNDAFKKKNSKLWRLFKRKSEIYSIIIKAYQKCLISCRSERENLLSHIEQDKCNMLKMRECACLIQIGHYQEKIKNFNDAITTYSEICNDYWWFIDKPNKISYLEKISQLSFKINNFDNLAKINLEIGDLFYNDEKLDMARQYYERAYNHSYGKYEIRYKIILKLIEIYISIGEYSKAIERCIRILDDVVNYKKYISYVEIYDIHMYILLCFLCENKFEKYNKHFIHFCDLDLLNQDYYKMCSELYQTYRNCDLEKFKDVCKDYNNDIYYNPIKTKLIQILKNQLD